MSTKNEVIRLWKEKAEHDLGTAEIIFSHIPAYQDTIAFHCQQAAEKYLKALLLFYDIPFKRQHSLNYLLGLLSAQIEISDELYEKATVLEDFAVEIRYPDMVINLSEEELINAIDIAKEIKVFVEDKLGL